MNDTSTEALTFREGDAFVNFSLFEVQATLANRLKATRHEYVRGPKTRFSRPLVKQPVPGAYRYDGFCLDGGTNHFLEALDADGNPTEDYQSIGEFPALKVGQRLFVREGWGRCEPANHSPKGIIYRADFKQRDWGTNRRGSDFRRYLGPGEAQTVPADFAWKRSTAMRADECRVVLEVTGVGAEPVQAITVDDAWAEGVWEWGNDTEPRMNKCCKYTRRTDPESGVMTVRGCFAAYWDTLYALPTYRVVFGSPDPLAFASNPWVAVVHYKRLLPENEWKEGEQ